MIKIEISAHYGPDMPRLRMQVDEAMEAIGFRREAAVPVVHADFSLMEAHNRSADGLQRERDAAAIVSAQKEARDTVPARYTPEAELPVEAQAAKVETKPAEPEAPKAARRGRMPKAEATPAPAAEQPAISTGEARVGPEDPPEVQEQDAADEAAETAATRKADATLDDVRAALGDYVTKFGMPAAQEDGPKVLKMLFGDEVSKISAIPDGVKNFTKAVDGVREMLAKNPFKREPV